MFNNVRIVLSLKLTVILRNYFSRAYHIFANGCTSLSWFII